MPKALNNWTFKQVTSFLKEHNFVIHRTKGSHFHYKKLGKDKNYLVSVPFHGNKSIPNGTMNSIVRQSGIEKEKWAKRD